MALPPAKNSANGRAPVEGDIAFLREVDDAVRQGDLAAIGRRYGPFLIAALVVLLTALGGSIWWSGHRAAQRGVAGEHFVTALDSLRAGRPKAADRAYQAIANDPSAGAGYHTMATLMRANIAQGTGDPAKAAGLWKQVESSDAPQPWRDLALVRRTAAEFDTLSPQQVIARLRPLAQPGNPWFGSAGEMTAIAYLRENRRDLAGSMFAALTKDKGVPATIRSRAGQMAGVLGVDVVQAADTDAAAGTGAAAPAGGA